MIATIIAVCLTTLFVALTVILLVAGAVFTVNLIREARAAR